jgi:hypothetical protein
MIKIPQKESGQSLNQADQGSDSELQHGDITRRIIGCAMKVHTALGNGFQEVIYQRALAIEMGYEGLAFEREGDAGFLSWREYWDPAG